MSEITAGLKKRPLAGFYLLACGLSWAIQVPLALQAQGLIRSSIPFSTHYLSAFGPMLAAWIVTLIIAGPGGWKELLGKMTKVRLPARWWLWAVSPLLLYLAAALAVMLLSGRAPVFHDLGKVDFLPDLGAGTLFLWVFTFGFGEETGWRGFALPRLQRGRSALTATLILWGLWALWHSPLFFYAYDLATLPGFLIGLLAGAVTLTWLYNSTGSIWIAALFHGTFNFTTACTACKSGIASPLISAAVMAWAVLIVIRYKPAKLSAQQRLMITPP